MSTAAPFGWRAPGELTVEKGVIESDSSSVLASEGVEVKGIDITEEHQDGDPIEPADAWLASKRTQV